MVATTLNGVMLTGDHASRPAASAVAKGALYSCTTHSLIYQSDASSWSTWATLTGTGLSDPMTTRGDIIVRDSSNTTARLAIGSSGKVLSSDGTDVSWQTPSAAAGAGSILGITANTAGDQSITSATMADLPTSISVTFTAPASGNVLVRLATACGATTTANAYQSWGVRESTSTIAGAVGESIAQRQPGSGSENIGAHVIEFYLTGISAGSHTYKWAAACSTSGGTFKANSNMPAVMSVIQLA